jgi:hypothetical protein
MTARRMHLNEKRRDSLAAMQGPTMALGRDGVVRGPQNT